MPVFISSTKGQIIFKQTSYRPAPSLGHIAASLEACCTQTLQRSSCVDIGTLHIGTCASYWHVSHMKYTTLRSGKQESKTMSLFVTSDFLFFFVTSNHEAPDATNLHYSFTSTFVFSFLINKTRCT